MPKPKIIAAIRTKFGSKLFTNSAWGVISNVLQNLLLSVFFIVIARQYSTSDFGNYVIANTLYGFILGFSAMGLGYWFIRELINSADREGLINKFFKLQFLAGIFFYFVNIILAYSLYDNQLIRSLSIMIGINLIFDNIIYVIKYINIADSEQKKSFIILTVEAVLKFLVACILFIYEIPVLYLSIVLIALRLITLNLFIGYGSGNRIKLSTIIKTKLSWLETKQIVGSNWSFMIIGSLSIIYWRIGSIIVSKVLTIDAVADYEISYKLFSMGYILPIIVSTSIFPLLIGAYKESMKKMQTLYQNAFLVYALYGLLAYSFIYSFADPLIPMLFGEKYIGTSFYCKEMFLTMITFPTVFLQANVLITLKLEKLDMICNLVSLILNISLCIIGFTFFQKSLSVVNYAVFFSFLAFHLVQDYVLVRKKVTTILHITAFYVICCLFVALYHFLCREFQPGFVFFIFWIVISLIGGASFLYIRQRKGRGVSSKFVKI